MGSPVPQGEVMILVTETGTGSQVMIVEGMAGRGLAALVAEAAQVHQEMRDLVNDAAGKAALVQDPSGRAEGQVNRLARRAAPGRYAGTKVR